MCAHFCYKIVHCGIFAWCIVSLFRQTQATWDWCIVGFVRFVYSLMGPIRNDLLISPPPVSESSQMNFEGEVPWEHGTAPLPWLSTPLEKQTGKLSLQYLIQMHIWHVWNFTVGFMVAYLELFLDFWNFTNFTVSLQQCHRVGCKMPLQRLGLLKVRLTYWGLDKKADIMQMIFWNAFAWKKIVDSMIQCSLKFAPKVPIDDKPV